ncbi:SCP2 sterol-binding domain-containing protein [Simiduia curdlanivorans]|uniref:Ubiquinone biosynthesis accessory factor UbiT n=1 Tax=Simiduia curdlanivorans TaxID=1492769 RepID=A0ABV8V5J8_9GAMM|nr:SCP2 sterol-binding domain-containing protein [Simiduia curdlanivorans]MDN3640636.1 SCP2 sterol-binding domain-containing protein [Simiduia curdlanivorans]
MHLFTLLAAKRGYQLACKLAPKLPQAPLAWALVKGLNHELRQEIEAGEFDFLDGKVLAIAVKDLAIQCALTKQGPRLVAASRHQVADATIAAVLPDLVAIIVGREDPDTLFFQRKLSISGDTELGLTAKNRLDAVDKNRLAQWLQKGLNTMDKTLAQVVAP